MYVFGGVCMCVRVCVCVCSYVCARVHVWYTYTNIELHALVLARVHAVLSRTFRIPNAEDMEKWRQVATLVQLAGWLSKLRSLFGYPK